MPVPMGYGYDPRDYVQDYSWINQMVGQLGQAATAFTQARENIKEFRTLEDSYQDGMGVALKDAEEAGISRKDATKKYNELYNVIRGKGLDWNLDRFEKAPTQWEAFVQQGFYKNKLGQGVQSAIQGTGLPKNLAPIGQPQNVETYEPSGVQGVDAKSSTTMQQYQVPEWYGKPAENIEQVEQRLGEMYPDRKITREDIESFPAARAIGSEYDQQKKILQQEKIASEQALQEYRNASTFAKKIDVLNKNNKVVDTIDDEIELFKLGESIKGKLADTKNFPKYKKDPLTGKETGEVREEYLDLKKLSNDIDKRRKMLLEQSGMGTDDVEITDVAKKLTRPIVEQIQTQYSGMPVSERIPKIAKIVETFVREELGIQMDPEGLIKVLEEKPVEFVIQLALNQREHLENVGMSGVDPYTKNNEVDKKKPGLFGRMWSGLKSIGD